MADMIVYSEGFASNSLLQLTVRYEKPEADWDSPYFIILAACPPGDKENPYFVKKPFSVNLAFSTEQLDTAGLYIQALCSGQAKPWKKFSDPRKRQGSNAGESIKTFTAEYVAPDPKAKKAEGVRLIFSAQMSATVAKGLKKEPDPKTNMVTQVVTIGYGLREAYALGRKLCLIAAYFQKKRLDYSFNNFRQKMIRQQNRPETPFPKAA